MKSRRAVSVRVWLTLWNVGVLALVLVVLGGVLRYTVSATLMTSMDAEIQARANRLARQWQRGAATRLRQPQTATATGEQRPATPEAARDPYFPRIVDRAGNSLRSSRFGKEDTLDPTAFSSALAGHAGFSTRQIEEDRLRIYSLPLRDARGAIIGVIQVPFRLNDIQLGLATLDRTLLTLIPLALLVTGAGGAFLTVRALQPVRAIMEATDRIEAQNLSGRLPIHGRDEFALLAARFNRMLGRLETAFERLGRFTADASHELRTPLAVIKTNTSLALEQPRSPEYYRNTLTVIDAAADRSNRIVQDLLFLARADQGETANRNDFSPLSVSDLLDDIESLSLADDTGAARLLVEPPDPALTVYGNAHQLSRVFGNLVENALRHTPPDGHVIVRADADGNQVRFTLTDTGEGIAAEHLPHVFERFYRVDADRNRTRGGTGLGLAIVRSIVDAHHGSIHLESQPGQGTRVTVLLPAVAP